MRKRQDRHPLHRTLAPLAECNRLAPVIRAAMSQSQIRQVRRKQWIIRRPSRFRRGDRLINRMKRRDIILQSLESSWIRLVIIAVKRQLVPRQMRDEWFQEPVNAIFDSLWICAGFR